MTEKARKRHLERSGLGKCPYCKAGDKHIEYGGFEPVEDGDVEQTAGCGKCDRRWIDVFRLVDVREIS